VNRIGPALLCAALFALTACASKGGLGLNTSGLNGGGTAAGYVDIDKVVAAHPLNAQLQSLQDQITELNASTVVGPKPVTPVQVQAQADLQRQLADAEAAYAKDLADRQAAYRDEEVRADSDITAKALGVPNAGPGGIMSGMQAISRVSSQPCRRMLARRSRHIALRSMRRTPIISPTYVN